MVKCVNVICTHVIIKTQLYFIDIRVQKRNTYTSNYNDCVFAILIYFLIRTRDLIINIRYETRLWVVCNKLLNNYVAWIKTLFLKVSRGLCIEIVSTIFTRLLNSARTIRGSSTLLSCYTRLAKRALCYVIASHPIEHASTDNPRFDIHPCCDKHARRRRNRHYLTYVCAAPFTLSTRFS